MTPPTVQKPAWNPYPSQYPVRLELRDMVLMETSNESFRLRDRLLACKIIIDMVSIKATGEINNTRDNITHPNPRDLYTSSCLPHPPLLERNDSSQLIYISCLISMVPLQLSC